MAEKEDTLPAGEGEQDAREPQPCMPCHGSGQVISNLGGVQGKVTCPWCRGGGVRIAGADAQEYRLERDGKAHP